MFSYCFLWSSLYRSSLLNGFSQWSLSVCSACVKILSAHKDLWTAFLSIYCHIRALLCGANEDTCPDKLCALKDPRFSILAPICLHWYGAMQRCQMLPYIIRALSISLPFNFCTLFITLMKGIALTPESKYSNLQQMKLCCLKYCGYSTNKFCYFELWFYRRTFWHIIL